MNQINEEPRDSRAGVAALNRCCAKRLADLGTRLESLVCNWEAVALADAIEAVCASSGAIQPRLLRGRVLFGLIRLRPPQAAVSAFQQSVSRSAAEAEQLFAEVDVLAALHQRHMPQLRKLVLELQLEVGTVKKLLLTQRLEGDGGDAKHQDLAELAALCTTGQELVISSQQVLLTWQQLVETMTAHVAPAWRGLAASLEMLQSRRSLPPDRITRENRVRVGQSRAAFDAWLDTAMGQCQRLQQGAEAAQLAISQLRRSATESGERIH